MNKPIENGEKPGGSDGNKRIDNQRLPDLLENLARLHKREETCLGKYPTDSFEMGLLRMAVNRTYFDCVRMGGKQEATEILLKDCTRTGVSV